MTTNLQTTKQTNPEDAALIAAVEKAVTEGDLGMLTPPQRLFYYNQVCASVGLNPMTRPLDFIRLNGKLVLYAKKDATDQLRKIHTVSIIKIEREIISDPKAGADQMIVTAHARDKDGKEDCDIGALPLPANGEARSNAIMKCITKAKRRVTLSICGMGILDESEVDTIKGATFEPLDMAAKTGAQVEKLKAKISSNSAIGGHVAGGSKDSVGDTPPPVPAAAKSPPKEPEVLPAAKKPGRLVKDKPTAASSVAGKPLDPHEWPEDLGTVPVLYKKYGSKVLSDLDDKELLDVIAWVKKGVEVEKWGGPAFMTFKAQLEKYSAGYGEKFEQEPGVDEPEEIPPPAEEPNEIDSFMETPYEEVEKATKPANTPWNQAMNKIRSAKNKEEFEVACTEFKKSGKVLFSGMTAAEAPLKLKEAQGIRDARKKELGL